MEQEHILNTHIDQLAAWWENAEKGAPNKGDAIIRRTERLLSNGYAYEVGTEDYTDAKHLDNVRILARAPKPKPAWHDAVAVIAGTRDFGYPRVFVKDDDGVWNDALAGRGHSPDALLDVTPLIEQKVTDEMVHAALTAYYGDPFTQEDQYSDGEQADMRNALTAALGLETE